MKKFIQEFKAFINKGNVMDLAVAVVIGAAFGKIVTSFTRDIIAPVISLVLGEQGFENYKYVITAADEANGIAENAIYYGQFFQNVLDFLIIAIVVFLFIKLINKVNDAAKKLTEEAKGITGEIKE